MGLIKKIGCGIRRNEGQSLAEYGLVLVLIMVVAAVAVTLLGNIIANLFSRFVAAF